MGLLLRGPLGCMHFQWSGVWEVGGARAPGSPYLHTGPVPTIQTTCAREWALPALISQSQALRDPCGAQSVAA